nr:hypothetical protein BaRGS_033360 [Batillaria attramentaria]
MVAVPWNIYLLGGWDAKEGLHAICDGGTIYLNMSGLVFQMRENFTLADKLEESIRTEKDQHGGVDVVGGAALDVASDTGDKDNATEANTEDQRGTCGEGALL